MTAPLALATTKPAGNWTSMAKSPLSGLIRSTGAWDGRELLVVGLKRTSGPGVTATAAAYSPSRNRWRRLPSPPSWVAEGEPHSVWTGKELVVIGGGIHSAYNPTTNKWRPVQYQGAPEVPGGFAMVWTGHVVLVWGGGCCAGVSATGSAYDPARNTWRALPKSPVKGRYPNAVWTGKELIIAGGSDGEGLTLSDAAAYNPTTRHWRKLPPLPSPRADASLTWTGREVVVVGGYSKLPIAKHLYRSVLAYSPVKNRWRTLPRIDTVRTEYGAVWTGRQILIWGGDTVKGTVLIPPTHGVAYTPATGRWTALPKSPLRGRAGPIVVWTGRQMLVWGGTGASNGARYSPA